ncbi:M61 family metallopeptidase [Foetidibacter luteolus]|uniref:M61 family metallopeptidase n=1 Tax=Foetidibacter luteolus TaxID=2608880 RepID=UPI00129ACD6E|nr:peptidase M61 [Foetidibacter luteolus]
MLKKTCMALLAVFALLCQVQARTANKQKPYRFTINLTNVKDDKVFVELLTPSITTANITYHLPKIIPGTYSEDDYGRYIEQFKAFDKKGKELAVNKSDVNSWTISNANQLYKLSYFVNDSFDDSVTKQVIFEPAGSNIQKDTNYVINNHCFLGYFDDMKQVPYEVTVLHPANIYGSTALTDVDNSPVSDRFVTETYNRIVDNPVMYSIPDTTVIKVANTDVLISVYSPNKKLNSKFLAQKLDTLLQAQGKYFGGKLPVDKYAFIMYFDDKPGYSGGQGALEHSYSSLYYFVEAEPEKVLPFFKDASAHEFFHIITPLTIHSDEIQYFDFNAPKMSEHLWFYEGSTEYHAQMVQGKYGIFSHEDLLNSFSKKITNSRKAYNDTLPFTVMSSEVLGKHKRQFGNVYQKGALINLCLDIKLLQLSQGKYGIMNLVRDLSGKYGINKGFKDSAFFDDIEKFTYPEIRQFLDTYVAGNRPLPLQEVLQLVGVDYKAEMETKDSAFSMGNVGMGFNPATARLKIQDTTGMNIVGRTLGYHPNDEIVALNGKEAGFSTFGNTVQQLYATAKAGDELAITVVRKNGDKEEQVILKAPMTKVPVIKQNVLTFTPNPTAEQLLVRNAWLKM